MKLMLSLLTAAVVSTSVLAENIAIIGGKVHTMTKLGTLDKATILIKDGKIAQIDKDLRVPDSYRKIDATGKVITPGFVGALTTLGLVEVSMSAGVVDSSVEKAGVTKTGAALDVSYALNPDSSLVNISRIEGVTSAATAISSVDTLFYGQGAVMSLGDDPLLKAHAFMKVDVGSEGAEESGGSRAALWVALESALAEAASVDGKLDAKDDWHGMNSRADVAALKKVLNGNMPLFMQADRAADIRQVIAFKQRHPDIKVVLVHGVEAWRVAEQLADNNIPVIIDPEFNLPGGFDQLGATLANAARLEKAGVVVAIGMDTHNIRLAAQHAGNAVANGLSHEAGLASLTSAPAKILGMQDTIGSISQGKRADIVIWSGDPLEVTEAAEQVFVNGEPIKMESRQTKLRDRYLSSQKTSYAHPPQYLRP
ncbi:amidohydrolase family protein [Alteromonas sp. ASW11-130]|uniref:amidohydrolase family protein n=1 Tax=Alteromonas sp. ASW11-130 TaxID=3015775 RepID=UPI002242A0FC|nr:amidohydrolase family protein [Alteromonas sp. ASW11-130]MCW8091386.1 amidohydrolase family protein [Alteromonas sp. ASW11-130]